MVVVDPVLVTSRRTRRLDTPNQPLLGQGAESVVHRLTRNSTDLAPHDLLNVVRRAMRSTRHRPQDSQTLSRNLNTVLAEKTDEVDARSAWHDGTIALIMDSV